MVHSGKTILLIKGIILLIIWFRSFHYMILNL